MFAYTSVLHLCIVHIRYFMTMMHGRLDERHRRPLNLDHLKFVTVGTCKLNNIYNLEQMLMLGPEDIAALFLFRRALYVVRFRQAVRYMMQYHLLWAIKPKIKNKMTHTDKAIGKVQRGVVGPNGERKKAVEVEQSGPTHVAAVGDSKHCTPSLKNMLAERPYCQYATDAAVEAVENDEAIDQETNIVVQALLMLGEGAI